MHSKSVAAVAAFAGLALASPLKIGTPKSSFSVDQVAVPRQGPALEGAQILRNVYQKYHKVAPAHVHAAAQAADARQVRDDWWPTTTDGSTATATDTDTDEPTATATTSDDKPTTFATATATATDGDTTTTAGPTTTTDAPSGPTTTGTAPSGSGEGEETASPTANDEEYLCEVTVGGNTLKLDFDTGSSDLWVFSDLQSSDQTSGHTTYTTSHGKLEDGETWNITYGDGSGALGTVYADTVVVAGVTATSQAVEAATSASSQFVSDTNDGLLGLAFSSINTVIPNQQKTFFDNVKDSLKSALFTARLRKGTPGTYDFGYIDSAKYTGSIGYTDVDSSKGFWGFSPDSYSIGSTAGRKTIGSSIADTGTTLLLLPDEVVTEYYNGISGAKNDNSQGGYTFDCSATLPDFSITVGGTKVTIPGSYINFQAVTGSTTTCFGGLQSSSGVGINIFGDVFLKAAFVVFDQSQSSPRLGFAQGA